MTYSSGDLYTLADVLGFRVTVTDRGELSGGDYKTVDLEGLAIPLPVSILSAAPMPLGLVAMIKIMGNLVLAICIRRGEVSALVIDASKAQSTDISHLRTFEDFIAFIRLAVIAQYSLSDFDGSIWRLTKKLR